MSKHPIARQRTNQPTTISYYCGKCEYEYVDMDVCVCVCGWDICNHTHTRCMTFDKSAWALENAKQTQ